MYLVSFAHFSGQFNDVTNKTDMGIMNTLPNFDKDNNHDSPLYSTTTITHDTS